MQAKLPPMSPRRMAMPPMDEFNLLLAIAKRAQQLAATYGSSYRVPDCVIDLRLCLDGGCDLKLQELLESDDGNFGHDVFGIRKYLDRRSGQLTDCFSPRFSA